MAERRMFAKRIIDSDDFTDLPHSAQALYLHLSMAADDDGFVNNPRKVARMIGADEDDLKRLIKTKYLIGFDSGIVVIRHWKMHNHIKNDRYKATTHTEEKTMLQLDENKAYFEWIQNGSKVDPQYSIGKVSIGKVSLGKCSKDKSSSGNDFADATPPTTQKENLISYSFNSPRATADKECTALLTDVNSHPMDQDGYQDESKLTDGETYEAISGKGGAFDGEKKDSISAENSGCDGAFYGEQLSNTSSGKTMQGGAFDGEKKDSISAENSGCDGAFYGDQLNNISSGKNMQDEAFYRRQGNNTTAEKTMQDEAFYSRQGNDTTAEKTMQNEAFYRHQDNDTTAEKTEQDEGLKGVTEGQKCAGLPEPVFGSGEGLIFLTKGQISELIGIMGEVEYDHYLGRLSTFIKERGAKIRSHFDMIKKWYAEDKNAALTAKKSSLLEKPEAHRKTPVRYGSFDPEEAMKHAIERSFDN